ncbi:protein of unknown function DUF1212 [Coriobacterium glomerans PW2]|uniref:Threonine/serine exporter-like N-terminal domain-containing protein n=1 Tax=Coriobacterium glomerans (strain ATCC 49209 / DSM 20642 / JCM 10262 / PW2) TaxID=700015 RepID=F2NBJ9_CORGP|nr:threonine/serine exporter family protein [Coriobacterium glomerans]AEB06735.1 protein of unknown function DUF1212 [Coriobacterium glomerans PW2]
MKASRTAQQGRRAAARSERGRAEQARVSEGGLGARGHAAAIMRVALDHMRGVPEERIHHPKRSNHMSVQWHEVLDDGEQLAVEASIADKSSIVCRVGLLLLGGGAGSWRVRDSMNSVAQVLGVTCTANVGLTAIECTCFDASGAFSEVVNIPAPAINTERIWYMAKFVNEVSVLGKEFSVNEFHGLMDGIEHRPLSYAPWRISLVVAFACAAFVLLLGGGVLETVCAFFASGLGCATRKIMTDRRITHFGCIGMSVAVACLVYLGCLSAASLFIPDAMEHEAGYIGGLLFIVPGFPLITSGLDIAKLDMRSGIERMFYALSAMIVAAMVAWLIATLVHLHPDDFAPSGLGPIQQAGLRAVMSFIGVYGFSFLFNSPRSIALTAAVVGAISNVVRLTLVDYTFVTPEMGALLGATMAGLLASAIGSRTSFPRISITVPSIVIMVPGLYMYRAVYCMGAFQVLQATEWIVRASMILMFLPMGIALARMLTDSEWRHCS